jgi:lysophospholipase L1-like esterase
VRVLTAGDSTLLYVSEGLAEWALRHPDQAQISVQWCQGCTFLLEPDIVTFPIEGMLDNSRRVIGDELLASVGRLQPDVVMLMATVNEVADRQWSVEEGPLGPGDPRFRERMHLAYLDLTMRLLAAGAPRVVWVVPPTPVNVWNEPAMNEPGRFETHHEVLREVVATFAADVHLLDLDAWLTAAGHADDPAWRADGVHLTETGAAVLAEQFLGPWLVTEALLR